MLAVAALAQVRNALAGITELLGVGTQHLNWFGKYQAFLSAEPLVRVSAHPLPLPARFDLALEDVSFSYPDGREALHRLTLHIPQGQMLAVAGENGAGKSTLARLLLRLYDPQQGRITVGGHDLKALDPALWRAEVAAVFQDFARFDYTLRENILLGRPEDPLRLAQVTADSGLDAVLARLPDGLDTRLGTAFGGTNLSGGQWQRLATARALYRDCALMILDEPTAALDPRSEREVFDSFARLSRNAAESGAATETEPGGGRPRTTLLITHRLGSVTLADRIVVLKAGQISEDGTHAELLARGGEYAELWALQARQYAEETVPELQPD